MELTIFAKKRTNKEGKAYTSYFTRMNKKDGSTINASVKFKEDAGLPAKDACPMIIIVEKADANLSTSIYTREDTGEDAIAYTLWVNKWTTTDKPFIDHSLDDFE